MVLCNDLAGSTVWTDGPPSPVAVAEPLRAEKSQRGFGSSVFAACAVTCAQTRATVSKPPVLKDEGAVVPTEHVSLPSLPPFVSCEEWGRGQRKIHPCLRCGLRFCRLKR